MGLIAFVILCAFLLAVGAIFQWASDYFAPNAPKIIAKIVWGVIVLIILATLFYAVFGGKDIRIPHV